MCLECLVLPCIAFNYNIPYYLRLPSFDVTFDCNFILNFNYYAKQKQPGAAKKGATKQSRINAITEYYC